MSRTELFRLVRLLSRRRWLVGVVALTTLSAVVLGAFTLRLYYRATAVLMPSESALRNPLGRGPALWADGFRVDRYEQEARLPVFMGLVKSQPVLEKTRQRLGLTISLKDLEERLRVEPAFGAAFSISALDTTSAGALRLTNGLAESFRDYYRGESLAQTADERRLLEERQAKIRAEMDAAEKDLRGLRRQEVASTSSLEADPALTRLATLRSEVDSLSAQLGEAQERRRRTEQELARQPEGTAIITGTSQTPLVASLQAELARLEQELASARVRYTDKHRLVVRLQAQIEEVKSRLAATMGQMMTSKTIAPNPLRSALEADLVRLKIEETGLRARLSALQGTIAENDAKVLADGRKVTTVAARMADYEAAQEAYRQVSGMLQAARIEEKASRGAADIQILQAASVTEGPAPQRGPTRAQLLLLGVVLSLGLGVGAAVAAEFLDSSLKSAEEVRQLLQLPLSGAIPEVLGEERKALPQITRMLPISPYAECYRFLRTSVLYDGERGNVRTLMVVAAVPAQGSSTTAANLALTFAEAGRRVVLVDADVRRPQQHKFFGVSGGVGLTNVLAGEVEVEDALQPTGVPDLILLPAGPVPENPSVLLDSQKMRETLARLEGKFGHVLLDAPPVGAFSDSLALASMVDGVILVVRVGDSSRGTELQAKVALEKAGANLLGVVVNRISPAQVDSLYYHSHYYNQLSLPASRREDSLEGEEAS